MGGDRRLLFDAAAWSGNVGTSVLIIFVNKVLMNKSGYGFFYGAAFCTGSAPSWRTLYLFPCDRDWRDVC